MKKTELTAAQQLAREAFVNELQKAGWDLAAWEHLFENGASLTPEAQGEHGGDRADLRLGYWMGGGYVQLDISDRAEGGTLRLRLYPLAGIDVVVGAVIRWQDELDAKTFPKFVKTVSPVCRGLFLDTGDGEFVSLAIDQDARGP